MVELQSPEEIEEWLLTQSRNDAIAIATRGALRIFPMIIDEYPSDREMGNEFRAAVILSAIRALAASWCVAAYPSKSYPNVVDRFVSELRPGNRDPAKPAFAAYAAAYAAAHGTRLAAADAAAASSLRFGRADTALQADIEAIDNGQKGRVLATRALWPESVPDEVADAWGRLKRDLLTSGENWEVWTQWYEARITGRRPRGSVIEGVRIMLDDAVWKAGPKAVNSEILRQIGERIGKPDLLEKRDASDESGNELRNLVQRPSSHRFDWRADRLEATTVTERPFDPVLAEAIAEALREKAAALLAALTGNHADDVVSRDVRRALDLLDAPVDGIGEGLLLMRSNSVAAHARAYADAGSDRERSIRAILDDISTSLGNLVDCYPGLRLINANRRELDVQDADAPAIAAQLDRIADLAKASPIVAPSGSAALEVGRAETADLDIKIAGPSGAGRAGYIAARAKVVAARLLDATNFASMTAQKAGSQAADLGRDTWGEIRKATPKAAARGLAEGVEGGLRSLSSLPGAGAIALMHHIGVPWEIIALMVPRLQPHARKVRKILEVEDKKQPPDGS